MREVKFRGMSREGWVYGHYWARENEHFIKSIGRMMTDHPVKAESVGQFTGYRDFAGTEIYENDFLSFINGWHDVVRFERGAWSWNKGQNVIGRSWMPDGSGNKSQLHIVGNTTENPELVE
ncbi:YopX protein [uncultured Caudovirales phage]|uniref:YopX protein n=1 Tax=uncultured Caudovirales phage TaxID=2100421 RepID=A0A6J5N263_9CAUD|nr:YopX protein [uncultured Caudovirales phage]